MDITWRAIWAARETSGTDIANDVDSGQGLTIFGTNGSRTNPDGEGYGASGQYPAYTGATTGQLANVNGATKFIAVQVVRMPATSPPTTGEVLWEIGQREQPLTNMRVGVWIAGNGTSPRFRVNNADAVNSDITFSANTRYVIVTVWDSENATPAARALMRVNNTPTGTTQSITQNTTISYSAGSTDEMKAGVPFGRVAGLLQYLALGTFTGDVDGAVLDAIYANLAADNDLTGPPEGEGGGDEGVEGDLAETAGSPTEAISGVTLVAGALAETAGSPTESASATALVAAALAETAGSPTEAISASALVAAALAESAPVPSESLAGSVLVAATLTEAAGSPVEALSGEVEQPAGTLAETAPAATESLDAAVLVQGALADSAPSPSEALAGVVVVAAELAETAPSATESIVGAGVAPVVGTLAEVAPSPSEALDAILPVQGAANEVAPAAGEVITASVLVAGSLVESAPSPSEAISGTRVLVATATISVERMASAAIAIEPIASAACTVETIATATITVEAA